MKEIEKFNIHVKEINCGNEYIELTFNDHVIAFAASYLGNEPLWTMIHALYELIHEEDGFEEEKGYTSSHEWLDEPGLLSMKYRKTGETLCIHLKKQADIYPESEVLEEHEYVMPLKLYKDEVLRESARILREYGICGYYESWADHTEFPLALFLSLLGKESVEYEDWSYKSSLPDELKTIMDLTDKKI